MVAWVIAIGARSKPWLWTSISRGAEWTAASSSEDSAVERRRWALNLPTETGLASSLSYRSSIGWLGCTFLSGSTLRMRKIVTSGTEAVQP